MTDPTGSTARFDYTSVPGVAAPLLATVVSALGAQTRVRYQQIPSVSGLPGRAVGGHDRRLRPRLGPGPAVLHEPHRQRRPAHLAGFPDYVGGGSDRLFESGDPTYRYLAGAGLLPDDRVPPPTQCPGSPTSTISTYDSQHRLVDREIVLGQATVQKHVMTYPAVRRGNLDANYARPTSTSVTSMVPGPGNGGRPRAPSRQEARLRRPRPGRHRDRPDRRRHHDHLRSPVQSRHRHPHEGRRRCAAASGAHARPRGPDGRDVEQRGRGQGPAVATALDHDLRLRHQRAGDEHGAHVGPRGQAGRVVRGSRHGDHPLRPQGRPRRRHRLDRHDHGRRDERGGHPDPGGRPVERTDRAVGHRHAPGHHLRLRRQRPANDGHHGGRARPPRRCARRATRPAGDRPRCRPAPDRCAPSPDRTVTSR